VEKGKRVEKKIGKTVKGAKMEKGKKRTLDRKKVLGPMYEVQYQSSIIVIGLGPTSTLMSEVLRDFEHQINRSINLN